MANNTGLGFNPLSGLGSWGQQQSVRTVADEYFTPQVPQLDIPKWNPKQLQSAQDFVNWTIDTSQEEKDKLADPLYELNKWNQGLRGLNRDELDLWERENAEKTEGQLEAWKERLWKNQKFVEALGMDAFQNTPDKDERDKMYENYLLGKPIIQRYGNDDNIQQLLSLTPEGKKELLQSDYKSGSEMQQTDKEAKNKDWWDYNWKERWNAITSDVTRMGEEGMFVGGVVGGVGGGGIGTIPGMAIGGASGMFGGLLTGITNPEDAEGINAAQRRAENEEILNKITVADNDRKKAESQDAINERWSDYVKAYNQGLISSEEVDKMWDNLALNGKREVTDELGNTHMEDYSGSNYYSAFKDEDEFAHFGTTDKLRYIAQSEVLAQKYGQGSALSILDQDMQNYVSDNQTGWTWAGNTLKNVWVGGVANLANNITALGALGSYLTYGEEGLANYLNGKDASGNGEENWFSPQYWNKVDQYNTFDKDAIAKADENGGLSVYNNVVTPGTEGDFWSWNTMNEAVRMNKFAWSDLLKNLALAKVVRGATRLAGGIEMAPGVLATESTAASQAINKIGSMGVMAGSSLGIDAAYGMQTYNDVLEQNNQKLNKIIDKDTEEIVKERIKTPQAQAEFRAFVDAENQRRKTRAGENKPYIGVDEDQAWQDYIEHTRRVVREEQETAHTQDRQEAMNDAANAFAIDATIEGIRMSTTNGMFKSYLFDKGTLNALKANNPYVSTTFKNGAYTVGKNATKKKAAQVLGMNIWGGFQSNYFDDITVGYAKGFGIQDYNNYLLQKYNPAAYGSVMDDYVNPYIAGMMGAADAAGEKRSFLDGTIGALGSVFTAMPNVGGIMSHKERMKQAAEAAEKEGKKNEISGWEIAADFINNPIVQAMADAKAATRMTEREIKRANDIIKEHGYSFDNMVEATTALNQMAISRESTSLMEAEDAKDREAFTLVSNLLALKNNGVVINAQAEPEKANWNRRKKASRAVGNAINSMLGVQVFDEAESPYTRAIQTLEDAASIGETNDEATVARQSQLVQTFLGLDANKNALENLAEEDKTTFAQERLKKNASNLLDMMQRTEEIQQKFDKSLGANMHPDVKQQLMYQYALDSRWKNGLSELEQQITGEENPIPHQNQESAAMAKYGSMRGYEKTKKAQQKRVEDAQKVLDKASLEVKKENDPSKSIAENARIKALRMFTERTAKENLAKEQAKLQQIESEETPLKNALEGGLPIVMADDILRLNADDRLRMLDDYYRNDYSVEQQAEIDKAKNKMMEDGTPINQAMERVRDAAILNHRIEDNMEAARKIMQNPVEASNMQQALVENRRRAVIDYFNDKIVSDAYMQFANDPASTLTEESVANKVSGYSTAVLNGMQKMAQKELAAVRKAGDRSDATLDNIVKGINAVLQERNNRMKDTADLDSFVRKTKKVNHTETQPVMVQLNDNQVVPSTLTEQVTTERELSQNDRKLLDYAMDYIAEQGVPVDEMAERTSTKGFKDYVEERNHQVNVEDRANQVSPEYMISLVNDVVGAFRANKDAVAVNNADKTTAAAPKSVATKPVDTKGVKPAAEEEVRPDEVNPSDPFGLKKKAAAPVEPALATTTETKPATTEAPAEKKETVAKSARNQEVLETAETLNSNLMEDVNTLLDEVDKMPMEEKTRDKLKDIIQAQLSSRAFQNIQALQGAVMGDAMMTNQAEAPQIAQKATSLQGLNIQNIKEKAAPKAETSTTESTTSPSQPLFSPAPMEMSTMDLDVFVDNPRFAPQSNYIKSHNIVSFLQKMFDFWRGDYEKAHKGQVIFIYDDALASEIADNIQQAGGMYVAGMAAPVLMAIEITDANKHLVEDQSQLIAIRDVSDNKTIRYYQPLGFMPANDNQHMEGTAMRMSALRDAINFEQKGPQILRYKSASGKRNGGPIQTNISSMQSHTGEESIPHGTESTPITGVQQLMEENAMTPTESLVSATEEEKQAYQNAKQKNDGKALRATTLYKKLRDAFISRLTKSERQAQNSDDVNAKEIDFKIQKGSNDTYPKIVLTKKVSETLDKNSGRPIVDLLREVNDSGDNAKEVIESNSRIKRLFNQLSKITLSKGLFNADGSVANQTLFNSELAKFESSIKEAIENNLKVDNLSIKAEVGEGRPSEKTVTIKLYSGDQTADNMLTALTTAYSGALSEAEFASFIKNLILDNEGNTRPGINDSRYERVKWQVNYEDASRANDKTLAKEVREAAQKNLRDLYDDGVFEMQMTKVAYPARNVTVGINAKMKANLWPDATKAEPETKAPEVTEQHPVFESETGNGALVEGDSGAVVEAPSREGVISAIPRLIMDTINKMIVDSRARNLTDDGRHYDIAGQIWSRVTSIKYAMDGMGERFDPNSPWALPSSLIGNSFDEFGRDVFNEVFDLMSEEERQQAFEGYDNSTAKNYAEEFMALKAFEGRLLEKGQIVIATGNREEPGHITAKGMLDVTVRGEDGKFTTKKVRVAGTVDVLAVDTKGNLHIYDFKTRRGKQTTKEEAIAKGYDRQLSMYAKFLEDEYGLKVASINIIPIKADYAAPVNQESYKESRPGSNQLLKKNAKSEYEEFRSADFEVGREFQLDRLSDTELTASFDKMTETEKESIVEALQDQSETPSTEITKTDEIINSKPEIEESPVDEEEEEGGRRRGGRLGRRSTSKPVDTSAEATAEAIAPDNPNSLKSRLKDLENACGGKKKG